MNPENLRLYFVADPQHVTGDLITTVREALAGGATMIQLRAKTLTDRDLLHLATQIRQECTRHEIPFIVNDRLDIALASAADGIHLGVDDLPIPEVRNLTPPGFIIGYSPDTHEGIHQASILGADYLGIGPVFGTATKADAGTALGLDEFANRCRISSRPVVGIGGIGPANAHTVVQAGAKGIAVVSAISKANDPRAAARELASITNRALTG